MSEPKRWERTAEALLNAVRAWVQPAFDEVVQRIDELRKQITEIPPGQKGDKGDPGVDGKDGAPGRDGKDGAAGKDGAPGARGEKGEQGLPGKDGRDGMDGKNGERGADGKDGAAGPAGERGASGERGLQGEKGDAGPRGERGEAGAPGPQGARGERGEKGDAGPAGPRGEKGDPGKDGANGKDGAPGVNGKDGRDALELTILPAIDEARSYPRGTYARHRGGLWRAFENTLGMRGWECIVNGVAEVAIEQTDERNFGLALRMSAGEAVVKAFSLPVVLDRGVYRPEQKYAKGDGVTFGGHFWIARKDEPEFKPGDPSDNPSGGPTCWRLAVKRGRDGKDAGRT